MLNVSLAQLFFFLALSLPFGSGFRGPNPEVFSELVARPVFDMAILRGGLPFGLIGVDGSVVRGLFRIAEHGGLDRWSIQSHGPTFLRTYAGGFPSRPCIGSVNAIESCGEISWARQRRHPQWV